jgi:adenine-specific DNA-methyltransferase
MEKLKMHSPNFAEENIAKLAALFPGCVTESTDKDGSPKKAIDFDLLRQELSTSIVEGPQERYHLNWPGKREALLTANAPIAKTLRPCREESVDFDTTENLFIEGDNLDALKLLQETYLGKVKMIYIDPPYNTGKDFIYSDNFAESTEEYLLDSGQKDEEGNHLVANTDSNGRFHSDWLSMMYPRLKLARNLLKDDGIIFISIDDNEVSNLRKMCDEIFGEECFVAQFTWRTGGNFDNQAQVKNCHENILLYVKNSDCLSLGFVIDPSTPPESKLRRGYAENSIIKNGSGNPPSMVRLPIGFPAQVKELKLPKSEVEPSFYREVEDQGYISRTITQKFNSSYPIRKSAMEIKEGKLVSPCEVYSGWANVSKLQEFIKNDCKPMIDNEGNTTEFYLSHTGVIQYKKTRTSVRHIISVLSNVGTTERMRSELESMGLLFQYPKPTELLFYLLQVANSQNNDITLDFFAGSATTAHAVMQLNAEDNGKRKFIMVQLPEACDEKSEAFKAGYKTIAEISKERIRRAGKKIKEENATTAPELDTGFRVLKVDSSNMADVYYTPDTVEQHLLTLMTDNIKGDRSSEDLLFQVLLDWGVDLTLPITKETIAEREVFFVDGNALAACFEKSGEITEDFCKELAARQPLRVVFRDSGFKDDSVKINVEQIFKLTSPHTDVKTI